MTPVDLKSKMTEVSLNRIAKRFSNGQLITEVWLKNILLWPPVVANSLNQLQDLEWTYDVLDAYLWLGMRFQVGLIFFGSYPGFFILRKN